MIQNVRGFDRGRFRSDQETRRYSSVQDPHKFCRMVLGRSDCLERFGLERFEQDRYPQVWGEKLMASERLEGIRFG